MEEKAVRPRTVNQREPQSNRFRLQNEESLVTKMTKLSNFNQKNEKWLSPIPKSQFNISLTSFITAAISIESASKVCVATTWLSLATTIVTSSDSPIL